MNTPRHARELVLLFLRFAVALVWLYNGLFLKVLFVDPEQLALMSAAMGGAGGWMLGLLGMGETGLALWIATGWRYAWAMAVQTFAVVMLNLAGIVFGGYADPAGLLIGNLPLMMCGLIGMLLGPGHRRAINQDES